MPRFFFDVQDGAFIPDDEGIELADLRAARISAAELAGALLKDEAESFWHANGWRVDVKDEAGSVLFALHFYASFGGLPRE